jgi:hypothetical protein
MFQSMVFVTSDVGPFWMTAAESNTKLNRNDHLTSSTIQMFPNKIHLIKDWRAKGMSAKGTKDKVQVICQNKDVTIQE